MCVFAVLPAVVDRLGDAKDQVCRKPGWKLVQENKNVKTLHIMTHSFEASNVHVNNAFYWQVDN